MSISKNRQLQFNFKFSAAIDGYSNDYAQVFLISIELYWFIYNNWIIHTRSSKSNAIMKFLIKTFSIITNLFYCFISIKIMMTVATFLDTFEPQIDFCWNQKAMLKSWGGMKKYNAQAFLENSEISNNLGLALTQSEPLSPASVKFKNVSMTEYYWVSNM